MLSNAWAVMSQVLILFLLIAVGYLAGKLRMLNETGMRQLTNLLLVIITPSIIIQSFLIPFDETLLFGMGIALVSAVVSHALGALVAWPVFRKRDSSRARVLQFSVVFSNCAFMCIPLLDVILGAKGVLYGSIYIGVFSVLQWTYGVRLMAGRDTQVPVRRALINPGTVTILVALPLFLLEVRLPTIPDTVMSHLAAINSPLAMIIIGAQLSFLKLKSVFTDADLVWATLLRIVLVPLLVLLGLFALPLDLDRVLFMACVIPAAAPTAAAATLFATRHNQDTMLATRMVALSTLLSILSIPALILLGDVLQGY